MAFVNTPTVELVNDRLVRITGVALASQASGTIGLNGATGGTPDIRLPAGFVAAPYNYGGVAVPLTASIRIFMSPVSTGGFTNLQVSIAKSGTTVADWRATLTNTSVSLQSQTQEIWVEFMGGGRVGQPMIVGP